MRFANAPDAYTGFDGVANRAVSRPGELGEPQVRWPRAFKSGNSQAIRIPAELAYADMNVEFSIERYGDILVITPARQNLKNVVEALRAMLKPSEIEEYEPIEMPDRARDERLKFLIDTNIAIHARDGFEPVADRLGRHEDVVSLSALSLAELLRGLYRLGAAANAAAANS